MQTRGSNTGQDVKAPPIQGRLSEAVSLFGSNWGQAHLLNYDLNKLNSLIHAPWQSFM